MMRCLCNRLRRGRLKEVEDRQGVLWCRAQILQVRLLQKNQNPGKSRILMMLLEAAAVFRLTGQDIDDFARWLRRVDVYFVILFCEAV